MRGRHAYPREPSGGGALARRPFPNLAHFWLGSRSGIRKPLPRERPRLLPRGLRVADLTPRTAIVLGPLRAPASRAPIGVPAGDTRRQGRHHSKRAPRCVPGENSLCGIGHWRGSGHERQRPNWKGVLAASGRGFSPEPACCANARPLEIRGRETPAASRIHSGCPELVNQGPLGSGTNFRWLEICRVHGLRALWGRPGVGPGGIFGETEGPQEAHFA